MISVVDKRYFNGPARVLVEISDFRKDLAADEIVESDGKKIIFDNCLEINLLTACYWLPVVEKISVEKFALALISNKIRGYVFTRPQLVENFKKAVLESDLPLLESSVNSLTGLGAGLTPSGDDFLAGFISASHFFNRYVQFDFFLKNVKINFGSTNLISAQYLKYAIGGRISEIISNIIVSAADKNDDLELWIERLLGIGASSGADTLYGILTAMEVYNACKFD